MGFSAPAHASLSIHDFKGMEAFLDLVLGLAKLFGLTKYQIQNKTSSRFAWRCCDAMGDDDDDGDDDVAAGGSLFPTSINLQLLQPAHQFAVTMLQA